MYECVCSSIVSTDSGLVRNSQSSIYTPLSISSSRMSDAIWGDSTYWAQTAVICAKEFVGVFMFLVAYSRMGMFDTFTGPLVTYMVLVAMAFPFLNSYLVFLMRYGPWYVPSKSFYWGWFFRTVAQYWSVTLCHGLGAWAASAAVKSYTGNDKWKDAAMVQKINGVEMVAPELSYRAVADLGDDDTRFMFFLEEFFAVLILLVGILHLMEAITPKLLQSAFWNPKGGSKDVEYELASGAGFSSRHRDLSLLMGSVGFDVRALKVEMDYVKGCVVQADAKLNAIYELETRLPAVRTVEKDTPGFTLPGNKKLLEMVNNRKTLSDVVESPTHFDDTLPLLDAELKDLTSRVVLKTYVPVPFMLVFQVCILLAGVSRAFPSAHLSLHVSVYNACMETNSLVSVCLRIAGGFLAAVVALLYYFVWYVWVGKPEGGKTELGKMTGVLYNNLLDRPSALLRSEMFRIPSSMAISIDPHSH